LIDKALPGSQKPISYGLKCDTTPRPKSLLEEVIKGGVSGKPPLGLQSLPPER